MLSNGVISRSDSSGRGMLATQLAALGAVEDSSETLESPQMLPFPGVATRRAREDSGVKRVGGADTNEEERLSKIDKSPPGFKKLDAGAVQNAQSTNDAGCVPKEHTAALDSQSSLVMDGAGELPPSLVNR